jgi:type VI secretion system protein ImpA
VAKETSAAIATKSKDLQLAVWLIEASYHRESFAGFGAAVRMTAQLLDKFWDRLYPELEDGDVEARVAPLAWLGSDKQPLTQAMRLAPIT